VQEATGLTDGLQCRQAVDERHRPRLRNLTFDVDLSTVSPNDDGNSRSLELVGVGLCETSAELFGCGTQGVDRAHQFEIDGAVGENRNIGGVELWRFVEAHVQSIADTNAIWRNLG